MKTEHSPADIIANWLVSTGLGSEVEAAVDWPVFVGFMPAPLQNSSNRRIAVPCIAVYDTQGQLAGRSMRTGEKYTFPGLQIMVRAGNERSSYSKTIEIIQAVDNLYRVEVLVNDTRYMIQNISRTSDALSLGKEPERDTRRHSVNAVCTILRMTE